MFHIVLNTLVYYIFRRILPGGACNFIKKETLAQVFSSEFCEISKNTFFYKTPLVAAFLLQKQFLECVPQKNCSNIFEKFLENHLQRHVSFVKLQVPDPEIPKRRHDVVLVPLLLTLNRFHTLFWCCHC